MVLISIFLFAISIHAEANSPAEEMLVTVDNICPELGKIQSELTDRGLDLFRTCQNALNEEVETVQTNAALNLTSTDTSSMKTITVEITNTQFVTVLGRLAVLRGGGVSGGLAYNLQPETRLLFAGPVTSLESDQESGIFSKGLGVFVNGNYATGDKDETSNEPGFDYDGGGFTVGADYSILKNLFLGVAFGYAVTNSDLDNSRGKVDVDGYGISAYGTSYIGNFYFDLIGTYGSKDYKTERNVRYSISTFFDDPDTPNDETLMDTVVDQTFKADTDADEWAFSLGTGYTHSVGGLNIGPYARLNYLKSEIDGYTEKLAQDNTNPGFGAGLMVEDQDIKSLTTDVGGQVSYAVSTGVGVFTPHLRFEWEHEFENDSSIIRASYINSPASVTGNVINIPTDDPDRDYFNVAIGVSAVFPKGIMAFIDYGTILDLDNLTSHSITGGIRFEI